MKQLFFSLTFIVSCLLSLAQQTHKIFEVTRINLSDSLAHPENQFSGLAYQNNHLYLLCESRLQNGHFARIYTISKEELDKGIANTNYQPQFQTIPIINLDKVKTKIEATGNYFEGLEAIEVKGNQVWLTIETISPSKKGYLLTGKLKDQRLIIDDSKIISLEIPLKDGQALDNSGYESIAYSKKRILTAFEYNYFDSGNHFTNICIKNSKIKSVPTVKVPFRITDWHFINKKEIIALNVFYKGSGDSYFQVPKEDTANYPLMYNDKNQIESFSRIIKLKKSKKGYTWSEVGQFPKPYGLGYNWEGIAPYKQGYFIANDKFTATRANKSYLLYVQ